jgi:long-chain acyl-CoA synthetase
MGVHAMLCFGGVDTLMPKFDALEAIELLKRNQINYVIGVPSLFENLIGKNEIRGAHLKNLHQAYVGGDYVAQDLKNRFDKLMKEFGSKSRLLEGYGLTEVVTVCAVNTLKDQLKGSVGKPLPGLEMGIVSTDTRAFLAKEELGEIIVTGDTMMNGYLENEEGNNSAFLVESSGKKWVLTGDYGFIDESGFVHFKQRLKRIIKVSGMPVLPSEIENLIMNFEEVSEVCAIGVPDSEKGNMIKLFLVATPAVSTELLNEKIMHMIKTELSPYALPREIVYLDSLPKTIIGKTDTTKLEKM